MAITASVVIPAYNRAHQLLLTLISFENQDHPKDDYEVIVVNDGSDDETQTVLETYEAPYNLIYTSSTENKGRAATRNLGVKLARGEIIIFCDADFLVRPDFISSHLRYHAAHHKVAVSGVPESWLGVFTHYYPEFSQDQKRDVRHVLEQAHLWEDEIESSDHIVEIITAQDVRDNIDKVNQVIAWSMPPQAKDECKRIDVAPWLVFITRCVSLRYKDFQQAGGFDEEFKSYGLEDWELGYRLSKIGVEFICMEELVGYHQEHPVSYRGVDGNMINLRTILNKHGTTDPEIAFMTISHPWSEFYAYKTHLRKLKVLYESARQTKSVQLRLGERLAKTNEMTTMETNEELKFTSLPHDREHSDLLVPIFYWSKLPVLSPDAFTHSVVLSQNGVPDCMWNAKAPFGGYGEPNGLIFFKTAFSLTSATQVRVSLPHADDLAIVYIDGEIAALSSVSEPMLQLHGISDPVGHTNTLELGPGEHIVTVEAVNAYQDTYANRAGVQLKVIEMNSGVTLASSANPSEWRCTGYMNTPPTSWYTAPGMYTVSRSIWNTSVGEYEGTKTWTLQVEER